MTEIEQDDPHLFEDGEQSENVELETVETEEQEPHSENTEEEESSEETGENESEPPADKDDGEDENQDTSDKMIPEHRFKAALKNANDKLTKAEEELAELKAQPAPDKETDPDGYELHNRIELSKQIMRDAVSDYDDMIAHYQKMAEENPYLNQVVGGHPNPAKHAYDIAKKDLEIQDLQSLKTSDEWKQFQNWKKNGGKSTEPKQTLDTAKLASTPPKVPNLNRATGVQQSSNKNGANEDDELFKGAL